MKLADSFPTSVQEVMRKVSLHIPIISKNYLQSPWCLAELAFMLKTGSKILPVFYDIEPNSLGSVTYAFSHKKKGEYSSRKLQEWQKALHKVSLLSGPRFKTSENDSQSMPKSIEHCVSRVMRKPVSDVVEHPVGLAALVADFEKHIHHKKVNIVGIVGMGGCGKTTLAREIFNRKSSCLLGSSFLHGVRKAAQESGLDVLKKQMLEDLLGLDDVSSFEDTSESERSVAHQLKNRRVLIVLDGIDDVRQLEALLPQKNKLGSGSLIIVTTRNVGILKSYGISSIYTMKALDSSDAKQLFCWNAFSQPHPTEGFEDLVEKLSSANGGHPLSLQVLGESLRGKPKDVWNSRFDMIRDTLLKDAMPIPRILVAKADSLKREHSNLTSDLVWLRWQDCTYPSIPEWVSLENMRILEINGVFDKLWSSHVKQPTQLRELTVLGGIRKFPKAIGKLEQLQKIVVDGYLNTSLEDLPEEFCILKSLEYLTLRWCRALTSLPTNFGKLVNLKHLDLAFNSALKFIPNSFNQLINLEYLDLESCSNLVFLPQFLGKINNLQCLSFKDCRKLKVLPSHVPCQLSLKSLNLAGTSLEEIPSEIGRLINLKVLDLGSLYLTSLPDSICNLSNLETLNLEGCSSLAKTPDILRQMTNLNVQGTYSIKLTGLPEDPTQLAKSEIEIERA
ncbi:hypothetical protein SUGI_0689170 [Cryptomeria japonica]|nr:hypothetical protein SUGI_0689170 [Cryptomeria japonica]